MSDKSPKKERTYGADGNCPNPRMKGTGAITAARGMAVSPASEPEPCYGAKLTGTANLKNEG